MPSVAKWTRKTVYAKSSDCDCNLDSEQDVEEEVLDLWMRDALVLIQELLEDPNFKNEMHHRPMHLYTDESWEERIFGEMWTADWWWETQVRRPLCFTNGLCLYVKIKMLPRENYHQGQQSRP